MGSMFVSGGGRKLDRYPRMYATVFVSATQGMLSYPRRPAVAPTLPWNVLGP